MSKGKSRNRQHRRAMCLRLIGHTMGARLKTRGGSMPFDNKPYTNSAGRPAWRNIVGSSKK